MSVSIRNLERAAQVQFVRAQKAEQKAEGIQHALNLMLNLGFERFHTALTMDGAVHEFELGTARNRPASKVIDEPVTPKRTRNRRIVLWRTMFPGRHQYASVFQEVDFRSLPKHLVPGSELRNLLEAAIERIPIGGPLLVKGESIMALRRDSGFEFQLTCRSMMSSSKDSIHRPIRAPSSRRHRSGNIANGFVACGFPCGYEVGPTGAFGQGSCHCGCRRSGIGAA